MKKLILFILAVIVLISCNKRRQVDIEGKVLNPITQEGIEGVELWLLKPGSPFEYYGGYKRVETVFTDANGNFKVDVKSASAEILRVADLHGAYYKIGWHEDGVKLPSDLPVQQGKNMKADFYAVPYGKLQINIKNTSCFNQTDSLIIFRTHSLPHFYDEVPNPAIYVGCIDQQGNLNNAPMGWYRYIGRVIKNGIETPIKDSIYLSEGETKVWNINY